MAKGLVEKVPDKLTDSEKKKLKQANKAKANPKLTAEKQKKKADKLGTTGDEKKVTSSNNDE
jgi:hypothetical protein